MTEQLYRRRAGAPVQVWRVGDGEPPEWAGNWNRWHEYHDNFVVICTTAGWKMQDATSFARDYEPLPAPAPDAREALEIAREALAPLVHESLSSGPQHDFVTIARSACDTAKQATAAIDAALARIGGGA